MKSLKTFLLLIFVLSFYNSFSQVGGRDSLRKPPLVLRVVDDNGEPLAKEIWEPLVSSGNSVLRTKRMADGKMALVVKTLTPEEKLHRDSTKPYPPKPKESKFFTTGDKFTKINTTDLEGNRINTKELKGSIIVLYYWKAACFSCAGLMPALNKLKDEYKTDDQVVFVSVCTDDAATIKEFLKTNPFNFQIIDNGRFITERDKITTYPLSIVLDKEGRVFYHSIGAYPATTFWIRKSIEEIKAKVSATDK